MKEFLDEVTRIHKAYKQQLDLMDEKHIKDKQKIEEYNKQVQILNETANYFKKKLLNSDLETKKHKKMEEDLRAQLEALIQEKIKLKLLSVEQKTSNKSKSKRVNIQSKRNSNQNENYNHQNSQEERQRQESYRTNSLSDQEILEEEPAYVASRKKIQLNDQNEADEAKEEFKNSKISVVSHLLNKKLIIIVISQIKENLIFSQDENNILTDRDEHDQIYEDYKNQLLQGSQNELEELIQQELDEDKRDKLKELIQIESNDQEYALQEKETQTDDIRLSDCEQINVLIHDLTQFDQIKGGDQLAEMPKYEEAVEALKKGDITLEQKMNVVTTLKNAIKQIHAFKKMGDALQNISKQNVELKNDMIDLEIKCKETEVKLDEIKSQNKQILVKYEQRDNVINNLEDQLLSVNKKRKQENRNLKYFFQGLVQNALNTSEEGQDNQDNIENEENLQNQNNQDNSYNQQNQGDQNDQENQDDQNNQDIDNQDNYNQQNQIKIKNQENFEISQNQGNKDRLENQGIKQNINQNKTSNKKVIKKQDQQQQQQQSQKQQEQNSNEDNSSDEEGDEDDDQIESTQNISQMLIGMIQQNEGKHKLKQESLFVGEEIKESEQGSNLNDILQKMMGKKIEQIIKNKNTKITKSQRLSETSSPINSSIRIKRESEDVRKSIMQKNVKKLNLVSQATAFLSPQYNYNADSLMQRNVQRRYYSPNQEQSQKMVYQIQSQKNKIVKPELPQNTISKFLTSVFQELVKQEFAFRIPLYTHCYDVILQKYGLKTVAEKKFKQILISLYCYKDLSLRFQACSLYCGITNAYDEANYQLYIKSIKYFYEMQLPQICNVQDNFIIPFEKIFHFIDDFFQEKLNVEHYQDLVQSVKLIQSNPNTANGMKHEDLFKLSIQFYEKTKHECKQHVSEIFYACDLDKNDSIEFYEFDLMYRLVETERYDQSTIQKQFSEEADMINPTTGEKALTLSKFVDICIEKDLFSKKKCAEFSAVKNQNDDIKSIEDLREKYNYRFKLLKYRFIKCNQYKADIKNIIEQLISQLNNPDQKNSQILWLSYRLIDQESINILIEHETKSIIENILPIKLQMLHVVSNKFEDIF